MKTKTVITSLLTPSEKSVLMSEIYSLWQEIGPDLISSCREMKEKLTNEGVIETLLDAQRLETKLQESEHRTSQHVEAAARHALTVQALEKFRQLRYKIQCRMIDEQLGPFV